MCFNARKQLLLIIMSKQTTIDNFISRRTKKTQPKHAPKRGQKQNDRNRHTSSRQCSEQTVRLYDHEPEVKLEVFQQPKQEVCPHLVLLTPSCMLHFESIKNKLQKLENDYDKDAAMALIQSNMRFHRTENIINLERIDDDDFWGLALPKLIQLLLAHLPKLGGSIRILPTEMNRVIKINRLEALLVIGCMFFGIMPKQYHEETVSMGELMTLRQNELNPAKAEARRAKLRCFMTYIKVITKNEQLFDQIIMIQRTRNRDLSYLQVYNMDREMPLRSVEFQLLQNRAIEDYCGNAIMIDFANKKLGGGVLKNGCVQQEILFAIFPQLLISKLVCPQLQNNEAVIIYGARRFAHYEGYSDSFRFKAEHKVQRQSQVSKSVFVAIDATDFSGLPSQSYQYSKRGVRREIHKAYVGVEGAGMEAEQSMKVCTGKWGCGAFRGDEELKFLIQWISVSEASRQMVYITDSQEKIRELRLLVSELSHCNTLEILSIIDEYAKFRSNCSTAKLGVLEYIKQFA